MSTSRQPTAATLRAQAMATFRAQVEARSKPIDWDRVQYRRARCQRFGHRLGRPEIQFHKQTGDRGRWFIVCRHDHPGDIQGGGTLFEFVSGPLENAQLQYLQREKLIADSLVADILKDRRRSSRTVTQHAHDHQRRVASGGAANPRSTYEGTVPLARRQTRRVATRTQSTGDPPTHHTGIERLVAPPRPARSLSTHERRRSPSVEIVDVPAASTFCFYIFTQKRGCPVQLQLPLTSHSTTLRFSDYDVEMETIGVKLADFIQLLVVSKDQPNPFWVSVRVCEISIPGSTAALVAALHDAVPSHDRLQRLRRYAYNIHSM